MWSMTVECGRPASLSRASMVRQNPPMASMISRYAPGRGRHSNTTSPRCAPGVNQRCRYEVTVRPNAAPPSSRNTCAHRSMRPFGAGVPVSPSTQSKPLRRRRRTRNRFARGLRKPDSSSMTSARHGQWCTSVSSHTRFSWLMTVTVASCSNAFRRWAGVPVQTAQSKECSPLNFSSSAAHVSLAGRNGATTRNLKSGSAAWQMSMMAMEVRVLPSPMSRNRPHPPVLRKAWSANRTACR